MSIELSTLSSISPQEELMLNPLPRRYRIGLGLKLCFMLSFLLGSVFYGYMVVNRRILQSQYLMQNQMQAVKLTQSMLPSLMLSNPENNQPVDLANSTGGQWLLVNLWATWCASCQEEMPSLERLQQKLRGKLKIIAISVDDDLAEVKKFISTNKPSFEVLWDINKQAPMSFGVDKYPETFLINPDGYLVSQLSGPRSWASNEALLYLTQFIGK